MSPAGAGALGVAVLLVACSREPSSSSSSAPPTAAPPAASASSPTASSSAALQVATPGVFARACEEQCSDSTAQITVYRDDAGAIGVVTVQGSPAGCSHPPLYFLGPDGAERAAIPFKPVVPGSPEAQGYQAIWKTQTAGLHAAETMLCRDVKH